MSYKYRLINEAGSLNEWAKILALSHSRCGTIKIPSWLMAISAEHKPKVSCPSTSLEMVMSPFNWNILKREYKTKISWPTFSWTSNSSPSFSTPSHNISAHFLWVSQLFSSPCTNKHQHGLSPLIQVTKTKTISIKYQIKF